MTNNWRTKKDKSGKNKRYQIKPVKLYYQGKPYTFKFNIDNEEQARKDVKQILAIYKQETDITRVLKLRRLALSLSNKAKAKGNDEISKKYKNLFYQIVPNTVRSLAEARYVHAQRTEMSQEVDNALVGELTTDPKVWASNPNKYDMLGVDHFPIPIKKGNFRFNIQAISFASEQFHNIELPNLTFRGFYDQEVYDRVHGGTNASTTFAFAEPQLNRMNFGPKATEAIEKGEIKTYKDLFAFSAIAHEFGHLIGNTKTFTGTAFDEGSNEILATRFTINSIQMDKKLRKEFLLLGVPHSYANETQYAGHIALIVNDGDEKKALKWIEGFRNKKTSFTKREKMFNEAESKLKKAGVINQTREDWRSNLRNLNNKIDSTGIRLDKLHKKRREQEIKLGFAVNGGDGVLTTQHTIDYKALEKHPKKEKDVEKWRKIIRTQRETVKKYDNYLKKRDEHHDNQPDFFLQKNAHNVSMFDLLNLEAALQRIEGYKRYPKATWWVNN